MPATALQVTDGVVSAPGAAENRFVTYAALLQGRRLHLPLDLATPVKPPAAYRVVGQAVPRMDIPAKATGALVYVQDMRVPGMLHGRVVRPPYAGIDHGEMVGASLISVDEASIAGIPGIVGVVVVGDFVGVVAEREEHAISAAERLAVRWKKPPPLADLTDLAAALRTHPSTRRVLLERGDVEAAIAGAAVKMPRSYVWPYQMHASIGPACSVADWRPDGLTVWSGTQNPHHLQADLALLMQMAPEQVAIHRMETAGCYGRNCADDVGADAALLSRAVGRPVRVQLTREQEHAWEPKGAAQLMDLNGGLDAAGDVAGYDFSTHYPSNRAPTLALILTGAVSNKPATVEMGDRTAVPPYDYATIRIAVNDMAPIVRAAWLRGVSALPNTFAHESYIDELAIAAGVDPVEYRLRYLRDPRAIDLLKATVGAGGLGTPHCGPDAARCGRRAAWPRRGLCALCPQHLPRVWRGLVGLGDGCRRRSPQRRGDRRARGGRAGYRVDDQPGRRAPPVARQCHPIRQPGAEGGGAVRRDRRHQPRMGRLPHPDLPGTARRSRRC